MNALWVSAGRCQFCHRTSDDVERLVCGDSSLICNECILACHALLRPDSAAEGRAAESAVEPRHLFQRLSRHFAPWRPSELHAASRAYPLRQQADLQRALDAIFGERRLPENFVGIHQQYRHELLGFAKLLEQGRSAVEAGPAQYEDVDIGGGETVRCLKNGLWLLRDGQTPYAAALALHDDYGRGSNLVVEVLTAPGDDGLALCDRVFDALEQQLSSGSCYRGRVISLEQGYAYSGHAARISVHDLGSVSRDDIVLPEETLRSVERNVLEFAKQRGALRALGMSAQKGLLFHGPPGTGKTHCIRYLAAQLSGHTTLLITAEGVGLLPEYMALARLLQPALVVIEDADLIARERTARDDACDEVMLNRLLNEMDGLRERADVFFVLTTNRPASLEPALASRPGRIDQAIAFPLPDVALRRRLVAMYAGGLALGGALIEEIAARTDGVSPAFIKELLRRVAQHHLGSGDAQVRRETVEAALHEMLFSGGALNRSVLGGAGSAAG